MNGIATGAQAGLGSVLRKIAPVFAFTAAALFSPFAAALGSSIAISPTAYTFPDTSVFATNTQTFTVTNVTVVGASITFANASTGGSDSFVVVASATPANDCQYMQVLPPAGTCTVAVQFQPFMTGGDSAVLSVMDTLEETASVLLIGNSGSTISASPTLLTFPDTSAGTSASSLSTTLTNTGNLPITFASNFGFVDFYHPDFPVSGTCQGAALPPAGTCTVVVDFHPMNVGALTFDLLSFLQNATTNSIFTDASILAAGNALGVAPTITSGPTYATGIVGVPYATVLVASAYPYVATWNVTSGSLPPGLSLNPDIGIITGTPTAAGTYNFTVSGNNGIVPDGTQNASITIGYPTILFLQSSLNFGSQVVGQTSAVQTATIINASPVNLAPTSISFTGGGAGFSVAASSTCLSFDLMNPLTPGATCTIDVTATPSAAGSLTDSLYIPTSPTSSLVPSGLSLSVTGLSATPTLSLASWAFGNVTLGGSASKTVTLYGGAGLSGLIINPTLANYTIANNNCGTSVSLGATCSFDIVYAPTTQVTDNATIVVASSLGTLGTISVSGTGVAPASGFSVGSVSYGSLAVGGTATQTIAFQNVSGVPITVTSFSTTGAYSVTGSASTPCSATGVVAAGSSCNLDVTFAPTATGAAAGTIVVNYTAGALASPILNHSINLSGSGATPATSFTGTPLNFGSIPVSVPSSMTATFTNNSGTSVTVTALAATPAQYTIAAGGATPCTVGIAVAAGNSCTVIVTYTPSGTGATPGTATVSFTGGALMTPVFTNSFGLNGSGVAAITFASSSVLFGNVPVTLPVTQSVNLHNNSSLPLTITAITNSDARFTVSMPGMTPCTIGAVLAAGANCVYGLVFTPAGTGSYNDTTTVTFQPNGTGPTYQISSGNNNGTGFNMPYTVSPASNSFGVVLLGSTNTASFTFTNNSNTTAYPSTYTINNITLPATYFSVVGSGGTPCVNGLMLPAGASCGMTVTFQVVPPGSTGSYNNTTTIIFKAGLGADPSYSASYLASGTITTQAPTITSGTPTTPAALGSAYSFAFTASGTPTITWSVQSGSLPPGLTLNASSGVLSGTPTAVGNYSFTVQAGNGTGPNALQNVSLSVVTPLTVTSTADSGVGTLRDAINYVNANCSGQTIAFNITGTGPFKIQPLTPLPGLACANMSIDGYTQPGASVNTAPAGQTNAVIQIWLDGALQGGGNGLSFPIFGTTATQGVLTVKGLSITGFGQGVSGYFNVHVMGNFIGVEPDGVTANKNGSGVVGEGNVFSVKCCIQVGTSAPADLNIIAATGDAVASIGNPGMTIAGNLFGYDRNGNRVAALGSNQGVSTYIYSTSNPTNIVISGNYFANQGTVLGTQGGPNLFSQNVAVQNSNLRGSTSALYSEIEITKVVFDVSAGTTTLQGNLAAFDTSSVHRVEVFSNPSNTGTLNLESYQGNIDVVPATVSLVPFSQAFMGMLVNPSVTLTHVNSSNTFQPLGYTQPFTVTAAPVLFSAVAGGGVVSQTLNITNTYGAQIVFAAAPAVVSGTGFTITGGTCAGATVPAAGTCTVIVSYSSAAASSDTGTLDISVDTSTQGSTNYNVTTTTTFHAALNGAANAPTLSLSTNSIDFGTVTTVSATPQTVTVTNTGSVNLIISGITLTGAAPSDYSGNPNPCPTPVVPGGNCVITIGFTPLGAGPRPAIMNILSNASSGTATVMLTGTQPSAMLSPAINFGNQLVGVLSSAQTVTFTNTSAISLTISGFSIGPGFNIAGTGTCASNLVVPAGGTCTVDVTTTPGGAGNAGTTLTVTTLPASNGATVAVSVTGVNPNPLAASLSLSPVSVTLGNFAQLTLTLSHFNAAPANNLAATLNYPAGVTNATPLGASNTCGGTLTATSGGTGLSLSGGSLPAAVTQPGSCVITVNVTANAVGLYPISILAGAVTSSLVNSNGQANTNLNVTAAPAPGINVGGGSVSFPGQQLVGVTSAAQVVTVTNNGNANLAFSSAPAVTGDFAISSTTCLVTAPVAPGGNCAINVTFTPTATGTRMGTISIASNVAGSPTVVNLTGSGATAPTLTISPTTATVGSIITLGIGLTSTAPNAGLNGIYATVNYPSGFSNAAVGGGFPQAGCGATVSSYVAGGTYLSATNASLAPVAMGSISCGAVLAHVVAPATPGVYNFTVPVAGLVMTSPAYSNTAAMTFPITVTATAPTASLALSPAAVQAGSPSTLTLTMTNSNNAPATAVAFTLTYPSGVVGVASIPAGTNCGGSLSGTSTSQFHGSGMVIPPLGACTVTVAVTGNTQGNYMLTLPAGAITSSLGATAAAASATLTVTPANAPAITFSPTSLDLGSQAVGGTSAAQAVTLTNSGNAALTISGITLTGDFAFFSNCPLSPATLAAGASCGITVDFSPLTQGAQNSAVVVASNAANGASQGVPVTGVGTPQLVPGLSYTPSALSFGNQAVGSTSATQSVILTNTGQANLAISSISLTGAGYLRTSTPAAGVTVGSCGTTLAPAASCHISVVLAPTTTGALNGSIVVVHNATGSPATVILSGTGTPRPQALITATSSLAFSDQIIGTQSAAQTVTISNSGTLTLNVATVLLGGANANQFSLSGNCVVALSPGQQCTLQVRFAPTTTGAKAANVLITSDATNTPNATVTLSGNAVPVPVPVVQLSASILSFGNVIYGGTPASQGVTLTNTGTAPLTILSVIETGNTDFTVVSACGPSLAAGAHCNLGISFSPHAIGSRAGTVTLTSNAAGSPHKITMTGVGCRYFSPAAARFFLTSC